MHSSRCLQEPKKRRISHLTTSTPSSSPPLFWWSSHASWRSACTSCTTTRYRRQQKNTSIDNIIGVNGVNKINNFILQFHPRKEIVAEPEEESKKKSDQGIFKLRLDLQYNLCQAPFIVMWLFLLDLNICQIDEILKLNFFLHF